MSLFWCVLLYSFPFCSTFGPVGRFGNKVYPTRGQKQQKSASTVENSFDTHGFPTFPFSAGQGRGNPPSRGNDRKGEKRGTLFPYTIPSLRTTSPVRAFRTSAEKFITTSSGISDGSVNPSSGNAVFVATGNSVGKITRSGTFIPFALSTRATMAVQSSVSVTQIPKSSNQNSSKSSVSHGRMETKDFGNTPKRTLGMKTRHQSVSASRRTLLPTKTSTAMVQRGSQGGDLRLITTAFKKSILKTRTGWTNVLTASSLSYSQYNAARRSSCVQNGCDRRSQCTDSPACSLSKSFKRTLNTEIVVVISTFLVCLAILTLITLKRLRVSRRIHTFSITRVL